ncbi:MAG TPA: methyltransferase domain-containing protein [Candidatus Dormibacteraeota bacterium]
MTAANQDQIALWNGSGGASWAENADRLNRELHRLGELAIDALEIVPGQAVLDVGCGPGFTSLELAARTGPQGRVVGVDVSALLLELARARAAASGAVNVSFQEADAQTETVAGVPFDAVFSRFGVMFFSDPEAAFTRLRGSCQPRGRLAFVCWQSQAENAASMAWLDAIRALPDLDLPPPPDREAPGPFAFGDAARVRRILSRAGWQDIGIVEYRDRLDLTAADVADRIRSAQASGPAARALATASPDLQAQARRLMQRSWDSLVVDGQVQVPRAAWLVTARP